jgi:hypothetical protein
MPDNNGRNDMASISTIRRYTDEDAARVKTAAERFAARHGIRYSDDEYDDAESNIGHALSSSHDGARLRKLWVGCYCRALRVPYDVRTTVGYGHVGVSVQ